MPASQGLFSSPNTCDIVARREFRENNRRSGETTQNVINVLYPLIDKFRHGKKPARGDVRQLARQIQHKLKADDTVTFIEVFEDTPPPSIDECYYVRVINRCTDDDHETYYVTTKIKITRHQVKVFFDQYGFGVVPHVASRYMQRERKPVETFHADIMRPLRMALPFGYAASCHDVADFAVPFATGLILGEAWCERDMACGTNIEFARGQSARHSRGSARQPYLKDLTVHLRGITFVGGDEIFGDKLYLREDLHAFEAEHHDAIDALFRFQAFNDAIEDRDAVDTMLEAAVTLTNSAAWGSMLYQRRRKLMAA